MGAKLEELREEFKQCLDEGRYDGRLAKRFFVEWIKEEQILVCTPSGTYVYIPSENRYMYIAEQRNVYVWLRECIHEINPGADELVTYAHLADLFKELKISPESQGSEEDFDSREDLINTKSGVLQLGKDGKLYLWSYNEVDAKFTVCINANYIPRENRSLDAYHRFLEGAFSQDLRGENDKLLFQTLGHLYSNVRNKKFLLYFVGDADTGKSTLQKVFQASVMGEKAVNEGLITFQSLHQLGSTAGTVKAAAKALWLISGETASSPLKNVDLIKKLTSCDGMQDTINGKSYSFKARSKVWVCGNWDSLSAFAIPDFDAIKSRMVPVIFERQSEVPLSGTLYQDLLAEIDSIFSYAVDSWAELMQNGYTFAIPESTNKKLEKRMIANNSFLLFMEEHCTPDPNAYVFFEELYDVYLKYSAAKDRTILPKTECRGLLFQRTTEIRPDNNGHRNRARAGYKLEREPLLDLQCEIPSCDDMIDVLRKKRHANKLTEFEKVLIPLLEYVVSDSVVSPVKKIK